MVSEPLESVIVPDWLANLRMVFVVNPTPSQPCYYYESSLFSDNNENVWDNLSHQFDPLSTLSLCMVSLLCETCLQMFTNQWFLSRVHGSFSFSYISFVFLSNQITTSIIDGDVKLAKAKVDIQHNSLSCFPSSAKF